jgi:hypothetical protein
MQIVELRTIYSKKDAILYGSVQGDIEKRVDTAFAESIKPPVQYDPVIEKIVWNIQKKVGAPRIRWSSPEANMHSQIMGHFAGPARANYEESNNTVYITPGYDNATLGRVLVSEDSHALQFNQHPIQSRVRYIADMAHTAVRAIQEHKSMYDSQHQEYSIPGTIENEAHSEIEPRLIEEALEEGKKKS